MDDSLVVYPTFPEIIKQLTPDEAKILKFIYHNNYDKYYPLINIKTVREQSFTYVFKNFTNQFDDLCQFPERISYYIDNLKRLGIINIPFLQLLADNNQYLYLKNSEFFRDLSKKASLKGERIEAEETYFEITKFGKEFLDACVLGKYDGKEE